jgi:hypothetical protein
MDTAHATFGSQMYKRLFTEFHEPYSQQEILMAVISHIGSTSVSGCLATENKLNYFIERGGHGRFVYYQ